MSPSGGPSPPQAESTPGPGHLTQGRGSPELGHPRLWESGGWGSGSRHRPLEDPRSKVPAERMESRGHEVEREEGGAHMSKGFLSEVP